MSCSGWSAWCLRGLHCPAQRHSVRRCLPHDYEMSSRLAHAGQLSLCPLRPSIAPCRLTPQDLPAAPQTAADAADTAVDYSKSAAQGAAEAAAAAKEGAGRLADKAQPYVASAAEQAQAGLGAAAETGQGAAQKARLCPCAACARRRRVLLTGHGGGSSALCMRVGMAVPCMRPQGRSLEQPQAGRGQHAWAGRVCLFSCRLWWCE